MHCQLLDHQLLELKLSYLHRFLSTNNNSEKYWDEVASCLRVSDYAQLIKLKREGSCGEQTPCIDQVLRSVERAKTQSLKRLKIISSSDTMNSQSLFKEAQLSEAQMRGVLAHAVIEVEEEIRNQPVRNLVKFNAEHKRLSQLNAEASLLNAQPSAGKSEFTCKDLLEDKTFKLHRPQIDRKPDLTILIPTRGQKPDVGIPVLIEHLNHALKKSKYWDNEKMVVRVHLGINGRESQETKKNAKRVDDDLSEIDSSRIENHIIVDRSCFQWMETPSSQATEVIPFGTIRAHCFDKASSFINEGSRLMSMDGDTLLTSGAIDLVMQLKDKEFTTVAYQLPSSKIKIKHPTTKEAFNIHWDIQSKMIRQDNRESLAYPAEPCFLVGPTSTQTMKSNREQGINPWGPLDCEGRFLTRSLQHQKNQYKPVNGELFVKFCNYKRFIVKEASVKTQSDLINWLSSIANQSQNMSGLDFFSRQISFALSISHHCVVKLAKHLYIPSLLKANHSLNDIKNSIEYLRKKTDKPTKIAQSFQPALKDVKQVYGPIVAGVLEENCLQWAETVMKYAEKKLDSCQHINLNSRLTSTLEKSVVDINKSQAPQPAYQRKNKVLQRPKYTKLNKKSSFQPAHLSSKRSRPTATGEGDLIPAKKQKPNLVATSVLPHKSQRQTLLEKIESLAKELPRLYKDLLSLLDAKHFGQSGVLSEKQIDQAFKKEVLESALQQKLEPDQLQLSLLTGTIRDLLLCVD